MCCSMDIVIAIKSKQTFEDCKTDSNWMELTAWWQLNLSSRWCVLPFIIYYFKIAVYPQILLSHPPGWGQHFLSDLNERIWISEWLWLTVCLSVCVCVRVRKTTAIMKNTSAFRSHASIRRRALNLCIKDSREKWNNLFQSLWFSITPDQSRSQ